MLYLATRRRELAVRLPQRRCTYSTRAHIKHVPIYTARSIWLLYLATYCCEVAVHLAQHRSIYSTRAYI